VLAPQGGRETRMEQAPQRPGFFGTFLGVCTAPRAFFRPEGELPTRTSPLGFFLVVRVVHALGSAAVVAQDAGVTEAAASVALLLTTGLFELYVLGSILGLGARWLGGHGAPESGRAVYAYSSAPYALAFVPYAGWLAVAGWLFVLVTAMAKRHRLSYGRALVATGMPLLAPIALTVPLALTLRIFAIEAFRIPSGSMAPTLVPGDHVFVNKLAYGLLTKGLPPRGAVIVFRYPDPDPTAEPMDYVKRVVGLPGDSIRFEGTRLFVNGWEVPSCRVGTLPDPYATGLTLEVSVEYLDGAAYLVGHSAAHVQDGAWRVAAGEVFVLGDNRENAADSRVWNAGRGGGVPLDNVKGPVNYLWWPDARWRNVPTLTAPDGLDAAGAKAFARCAASRPPLSATTPPPPSPR
jgi:signal peptidase I